MKRISVIAIACVALLAGCNVQQSGKQDNSQQTKAQTKKNLRKPKMFSTVITSKDGGVKLKASLGLPRREFTVGRTIDETNKNCRADLTLTNLSDKELTLDAKRMLIVTVLDDNNKTIYASEDDPGVWEHTEILAKNGSTGATLYFKLDKPGEYKVICSFKSAVMGKASDGRLISDAPLEYTAKPIPITIKPFQAFTTEDNPQAFETVLLPATPNSKQPTPHVAYRGYVYEPTKAIRTLSLSKDVRSAGAYDGTSYYVDKDETLTHPTSLWVEAGQHNYKTGIQVFKQLIRSIKVGKDQPRVLQMTGTASNLRLYAELPSKEYDAGKRYMIKVWLTNASDKALTFKQPFTLDVFVREANNPSAQPQILSATPAADYPLILAKGSTMNSGTSFIKDPGTYTVFCGFQSSEVEPIKSSIVTITIR